MVKPPGTGKRRTALLQRPIPDQPGARPAEAGPAPVAPRDLVDFHLRWAEFRPLMVALQGQAGLDRAQAETLGWLIALSDRVSAQDIG